MDFGVRKMGLQIPALTFATRVGSTIRPQFFYLQNGGMHTVLMALETSRINGSCYYYYFYFYRDHIGSIWYHCRKR